MSYQPKPFASTKLFPLIRPSIFPLHARRFILSSLLLSSSFPPHVSLCHSPPLSLLHAFPFLLLSILHTPCSYLFVFWSAPSSFFSSFMQTTRPTSLVPFLHFLPHIPPPPLLSTSWSSLIFTFSCLLFPVLPHCTCDTQPRCSPTRSKYMHQHSLFTQTHSLTALALVPSHQEKEVWGKLITNLKETFKWNSATAGTAPTGMCGYVVAYIIQISLT